MSRVVHTCHARVIKEAGPVRQAFLEDFEQPVRFGVHSGIAAFYGVTPAEELPATLDYVVAATGGWMVGTFGRALEVRGIPSQPDRLSADIEGDIVDEDGVMALRAVRIRYRVALPAGKRAEAERALRFHERGCPLANTLKGSVDITYTADFEETRD